jgi:hypothetical protein
MRNSVWIFEEEKSRIVDDLECCPTKITKAGKQLNGHHKSPA